MKRAIQPTKRAACLMIGRRHSVAPNHALCQETQMQTIRQVCAFFPFLPCLVLFLPCLSLPFCDFSCPVLSFHFISFTFISSSSHAQGQEMQIIRQVCPFFLSFFCLALSSSPSISIQFPLSRNANKAADCPTFLAFFLSFPFLSLRLEVVHEYT